MDNTLKMKLTTKDLVLIPLFSALIAVGAFIKIPIGVIPVSLQTVFVLLAAFILGGRRGSLAVLIYILLGLAGLPIFTGGGGPQYVLSPSFGYLLGMILAAFITGGIAEKTRRKNFWTNFAAAISGLIIIYAIGLSWLHIISNLYLGNNTPFGTLFKAGFLVFLPQDTFWCVIAAIIGKRLAPFSNRM